MLRWVNQAQVAGPEIPFRDQVIRACRPGRSPTERQSRTPGAGGRNCLSADITESVKQIAQRVGELFEENPDTSFAILVREGRQGQFVGHLLRDPEQTGHRPGRPGAAEFTT
jgi:DNA helicase-2/ATP-dependent DNA helicase PcrA